MADIGCSPSAVTAFDYFVGKGLRDFQAAGVVGNLQQESQLNPRNYPPSASAEQAFGIAAWHADRWQLLQTFFAGRDPWSLDTQLDFVWHELQTNPSYGLAKLISSTTVEDATLAFQDNFEKCGDCRPDTRIRYANNILGCLAIRPPLTKRGNTATVIAAAAVGALVATIGYGVYRALAGRSPKPELPPPPATFPSYVPPLRPVDRFGAP